MQTIVFCLGLNEKYDAALDYVREHAELLRHKKIYLYHGFERTYYHNEFSQYSWPEENNWPEIQAKLNKYLNDQWQEHLPDSIKSISIETELVENSKHACIDFLKKVDADMVITTTRGLRGIEGVFSSSFTEHLIKLAPCAVLTVREK